MRINLASVITTSRMIMLIPIGYFLGYREDFVLSGSFFFWHQSRIG